MSMSEFDEQLNSEGNDITSLAALELVAPSDFEEDDLVFAHELNSLFSPEQEELPPYFVQTLLASEEHLFQPVEPGFEHKTRARVFRRLKLRRRLFHAPRSAFDALLTGLSSMYARGSLLVSALVFTLIMFVTVAFTAPSFAAGMTILLHGARGGVYQVSSYPKSVHTLPGIQKSSHNHENDQTSQLTLLAAQQQLHFKIYWPQWVPNNYAFDSIYLYHGAEKIGAEGPIIELVYRQIGTKVKGTGQIVIREFLQDELVLPVIMAKAAHPVQVDQNGQPLAISVNGQWDKNHQAWSYGGRSELIYQQNGVLFWIAGDQIDGIGEKALWHLAQSFHTTTFNPSLYKWGDMIYVTQANLSDMLDPFSSDIYRAFSDDNPSSSYYFSVSSSPTETFHSHIGMHSH